VALDLHVSESLRAEGLAREVVRLIQDARKSDGLDVSDRISLRWATKDADLAAALTAHGELIAGEVLAVWFGAAEGPGDAGGSWHEHADPDLGLRFWLGRA
jgi:isoleucyl-tRNA synthetase